MANNVDQTNIAERVYDAVEALVKSYSLTLCCEYEYLPTERAEMPCVSMQTLAGDPIERQYLDGSYIANYRFALVLRQPAGDTSERIDAPRILRELVNAIKTAALDLGESSRVWDVRADTLPARIQSQPGCTDYQVTLTVKYKISNRKEHQND